MRVRFVATALALLTACNGTLGGDDAPDGSVPRDGAIDPPVATCTEARPYFEEHGWPEVFSRCVACHAPGGTSGGTRFVLRPTSVDGWLRTNFDIVRAATALEQDGMPLLSLKPTGAVPHGGGTVIAEGTPEREVLAEMLRIIDADPTCGDVDPPAPVTEGLVLLDELGTLRKASLQIAGRVPSDDEIARVRAAMESGTGWAALDEVLLAQMRERGFHQRVIEIFGDVLRTDRSLYALGFGGILSGIDDELFPNRDYAGPPWEDPGRRVVDSIAREPLELIAHVIDEGRPLTEIVTAHYRLVNPLTAPVYSLDVDFEDEANPDEWREVEIPAMHGDGSGVDEYAGVLTTPAFLEVVTGMATNRNRRRARFVYQWFLDFDVMRTSTRIDFSTVDFHDNPWLNDERCTGCHAQIDPVAGLFQNWTDCYDSGSYRYFAPSRRYCGGSSWWPEGTMFQPGLRAGERMPAAQIPEALEHLARSIAEDPGFARAMVRHVFSGLTGHPTLDAPQNTADPAFVDLQFAYDAQRAYLEDLATRFAAAHFDTRWLVLQIVRSEAFRAVSADEAGREELVGMGGGSLTTPELLHRRIQSIVGLGWADRGAATREDAPSESPYHLLAWDDVRLHAGGTDHAGSTMRLERPSGLTSAVWTRMAYETSCAATARDFARPAGERLLFGEVERTLVASGDPDAADQAPILRALQHLHARVLGEHLAEGDPELRATYQLLVDLRADAMSEDADLGACASTIDHATGEPWPGGFEDDPSRMVRAWQGVLAYLLSDYLFLFE